MEVTTNLYKFNLLTKLMAFLCQILFILAVAAIAYAVPMQISAEQVPYPIYGIVADCSLQQLVPILLTSHRERGHRERLISVTRCPTNHCECPLWSGGFRLRIWPGNDPTILVIPLSRY